MVVKFNDLGWTKSGLYILCKTEDYNDIGDRSVVFIRKDSELLKDKRWVFIPEREYRVGSCC